MDCVVNREHENGHDNRHGREQENQTGPLHREIRIGTRETLGIIQF